MHDCIYTVLQNLHFTYRVFRYTYSMTYSSGFVIIIPDKTTISRHQMDTRLTRFVLDTRLVLETRLILEQVTKTPPACNGDPASIWDPACIRSFTVNQISTRLNAFARSWFYNGTAVRGALWWLRQSHSVNYANDQHSPDGATPIFQFLAPKNYLGA